MGCLSSLSFFCDEKNINDNIDLSINKEIVDNILKSAPERNKSSFEELSKYLKTQFQLLSLTKQDITFLVYKWIANNITFDCEKYIENYKNKEDIECLAQEEIFSEGKGITHDFTSLFITILSDIDPSIETVVIKGYIKDILYKIGKEFKGTNHEWLAVKINNRWNLVDPILGAGYFTYKNNNNEKMVFINDYSEYYFFTKPDMFIRSHFPETEVWQLVAKKMTLNNFYNLPLYKSHFFRLGFKSIEPNEAIIKVNKEGKIIVNLEKDADISNLFINAGISYKEDNKSINENNSILVEKRNTCFVVFFYVNKNIEHKLTIYGINTANNEANGNKEDFKELVKMKIINENKNINNILKTNNTTETIINENNKDDENDKIKIQINDNEEIKKNNDDDNKKIIKIDNNNKEIRINNNDENEKDRYYPTIFGKFILSDIILIEPRNYYLTKGEKINFKIETKMYDNKNLFFVLQDEKCNQVIELEKIDNNILEENEIYIHGTKANLVYLHDNNYMDFLLEYKIVDNPNVKEKITYPKCNKSIKNKLLEPLCDTLKKGENVSFKIEIKSDKVEKVVGIDSDIHEVLDKEGNIFFKEIKIVGKGNTFKIAYKQIGEDSFRVMYTYNIV